MVWPSLNCRLFKDLGHPKTIHEISPTFYPSRPSCPVSKPLKIIIDKQYQCRYNGLVSSARSLRALRTMLARHAVPLTAPAADPRLPRPTPSESTLIETLQVFILNNLNLFRLNTFSGIRPFAQFWCNLSPFRINTSKSVSKQTTLTPFRMNTYEKQGGGGGSSQTVNSLPRQKTTLRGLLCFSNPCALFTKTRRGGVPLFAERTAREELLQQDSSHPYTLVSLLPYRVTFRNGDALPAAMGAAAKRAYRLQERRSCPVIQLFAGGGGVVGPCLYPLPPCRPNGRPVCTVKSEGTAKSAAAGSVRWMFVSL